MKVDSAVYCCHGVSANADFSQTLTFFFTVAKKLSITALS